MSTALDTLAALRLEDGRAWGEVATPVQWADARAIIEGPEPFHFITRARGYSKSTDLAAVFLALMLDEAPPGARLYWAASDEGQGTLALDTIAGFRDRTGFLAGRLDVQTRRAILPESGVSLTILPADGPGAWGLRPWAVAVDERSNWADTPSAERLWTAISSAVAKVAGCRMAIITTAGEPGHPAAKILAAAKESELWRVSETPGPAPWADPARLAEQRARLPESVYRRLFENEWTTSEDRLATAADLAACVTHAEPLEPQEGRRYVVSLDIGLTNDATVACICHAERLRGDAQEEAPLEVVRRVNIRTTGLSIPGIRFDVIRERPERPEPADPITATRVVLDRLEVWQGSREQPVDLRAVEEWLANASSAYGRATVVFDPWQAHGTAQRLRARGVRCEQFTFSAQSVGRLAATLHTAIRNRALALIDDEALLDELAHVRLRETTPGVVRMDHDSGRHDDRAVALGLAVQHLLGQPASGAVRRAQTTILQ